MNLRKASISLSLCFLLAIFASAAVARTEGTAPPPPPVKFGLSGICIDPSGTYLYVLAGGKILQYQASSMSITAQADLPEFAPPQSPPPPKSATADKFPPPPHMHGAPHGLCIDPTGTHLYVLAGPAVYRYVVSTSSLTYEIKTELPKPEAPALSR